MLRLERAKGLIKANIAMGVPKSVILKELDIDRKTLDSIIGFAEVMTETEVVEAYGVSRASLRSLVKDEVLTHHLINDVVSYKIEDIRGVFK